MGAVVYDDYKNRSLRGLEEEDTSREKTHAAQTRPMVANGKSSLGNVPRQLSPWHGCDETLVEAPHNVADVQ